jgi:hypothetical protein
VITKVAGHDPGGLLAQERPLGGGHPPGRGIQPVPTQDGADGSGGDLDAEALEFPLDPLVAPARVLPGQADDQLLHVIVQRWSSGLMVRVRPGAGDQAAVPAQQRLRPDEEAGPAAPGQDAADRGEQRPVGGLELGPRRLAAQHRELVAQDEDFQLLIGIEEASRYRPRLDRTGRQPPRSEFLHPMR